MTGWILTLRSPTSKALPEFRTFQARSHHEVHHIFFTASRIAYKVLESFDVVNKVNLVLSSLSLLAVDKVE